MLTDNSTFKRRTVTTVDLVLNGDDLEFTVVENDSQGSQVVLQSGDYVLSARKDDLAALTEAYPPGHLPPSNIHS